jgi:hypothetical protein
MSAASQFAVVLCRYMTLANRRDFLDALLTDIGERKQRRVVLLLTDRLKRTTTLRDKYEADLKKNEELARRDNVHDHEAAVEAFKKAYSQPASVPLDDNQTHDSIMKVRMRVDPC